MTNLIVSKRGKLLSGDHSSHLHGGWTMSAVPSRIKLHRFTLKNWRDNADSGTRIPQQSGSPFCSFTLMAPLGPGTHQHESRLANIATGVPILTLSFPCRVLGYL